MCVSIWGALSTEFSAIVKDLGFGWMFNGIFRGFTIMSSLCKCLSHFTLF